MSGIVEVIQKAKILEQMSIFKLTVKIDQHVRYDSVFQFNILFLFYFRLSLFRPMSANFEGISPLSVWLWLQNFNSKPNMLIYLWTKAWISQFVACHWERGQRSC